MKRLSLLFSTFVLAGTVLVLSPTGSVGAASSPAPCQGGALTVAAANPQGAAGTVYVTVLVVNTGTTACTVDGYPTLHVLTTTGAPYRYGAVAHRPAGTSSVLTPHVIALGHDGVASLALSWNDFGVPGAASCHVGSIVVDLPDVGGSPAGTVTIQHSFWMCQATGHDIYTTPLEKGPSPVS